jgi:1,4-alpha-glucan branching enzyme
VGSLPARRIEAGRAYKYRIVGPGGALQPLKADPFALPLRTAARNGERDRCARCRRAWGDADQPRALGGDGPAPGTDLDLRSASRFVADAQR